jgi:hypothetical protein
MTPLLCDRLAVRKKSIPLLPLSQSVINQVRSWEGAYCLRQSYTGWRRPREAVVGWMRTSWQVKEAAGGCKKHNVWWSVVRKLSHHLWVTAEVESSELLASDCLASRAASLLHVVCYQVGLRTLSPGLVDCSISTPPHPIDWLTARQDLKTTVGTVPSSLGYPYPVQNSKLCLLPTLWSTQVMLHSLDICSPWVYKQEASGECKNLPSTQATKIVEASSGNQ